MPTTVALADSHPIFLSGLKQMLEAESGFKVVAMCADGAEALGIVATLRPQILVTDLHLKNLDGLALLSQLQALGLPTRAVVLTHALGPDQAIEVMRHGAAGVVLKDMAPELLKRCIRKVAAGGRWMETHSVAGALERVLQREAAVHEVSKRVSARELEIIRSVAAGLRNKEIARALSITEGTVKVHLHSIYDKLKIRGRGALAAYAQRKGLV